MSDSAITGQPEPFEFGGLRYLVAPRTLGAECLFQTWLEREAYLSLARHREAMGEAEFAEARRDWGRDCGAKLYTWGKPLAHGAFFSAPGLRHMLWLKINEGAQKGGPRITEEGVAKIAADPEAWGRLVELMMRQDFPEPDPNAPGAAA